MKYKTTRKAVCASAVKLVYAGYCDLQHLLKLYSPTAYTSGKYGWNFDVYQVCGVTICTGYRNMPGRRANGIEEFDNRAKELLANYEYPYDVLRNKMELLVEEFCAQA